MFTQYKALCYDNFIFLYNKQHCLEKYVPWLYLFTNYNMQVLHKKEMNMTIVSQGPTIDTL